MNQRKSGILLHVTSLPSPFGIGDVGPAAYRFIDFLSETKQGLWQILPLNPTDPGSCNSPYQSHSALAVNPLLISPENLVDKGLLESSDLEPLPVGRPETVDYPAVLSYKRRLFQKAFRRFQNGFARSEFDRFCTENAFWLGDFGLFMALKSHFGGKVWSEWPPELRDRRPEPIRQAEETLRDSIQEEKFLQYLFFRQWDSLKAYAKEKGVRIVGDIPIYTVYDSVDVWVHPHLFNLDDRRRPVTVAGVPPDYFSKTGQLWGNPVYCWEAMKENGYEWWLQRIGHSLRLYDFVRIDHFRGFVAYWHVPADRTDAIKGEWVQAPAVDFFTKMTSRFSPLPVIAEDLGTITPDVREVMARFSLPGMKVLLFAFGGDSGNPYLPHNYISDCVVYTGTHDNNTTRAWFEGEAAGEERGALARYLGKEPDPDEIHWDLIRMAMMSVAKWAIFPLQDILGLGPETRMNRPSTTEGNWEWRTLPGQITPPVQQKLLEMTTIYGRAGEDAPDKGST
jgi:4-alpha-glucanotransferase